MICTFLKAQPCITWFTLMSNPNPSAMPSAQRQKHSPIDFGINWILRLIPAVIVGRAAYMKLSGAEGASKLFTALEMEPGGRILIGVIEAVCIVLLLSPRISAWGAVLCLGVMTGAIIAHVSVLGFNGSAGQLFGMAMLSTASAIVLIYRLRHQIPFIHDMFNG